jgi:hypothetical protein
MNGALRLNFRPLATRKQIARRTAGEVSETDGRRVASNANQRGVNAPGDCLISEARSGLSGAA